MKKKGLYVILVIGIILVGLAGYFYFIGGDNTDEGKEGTSNTNIMEEKTTETTKDMNSEGNTTASGNEINKEPTTEPASDDNATTATEQKKELPKDYVWDTERLGEPPQIVYDFAENQERFDYIVEKVDSVVGEGDGFSTGLKYKGIYYDSNYKGIEKKLSKKFEENARYILENTRFYEITKKVGGDWIMYYNQEEDRDRFIFIMSYRQGMTDEQAYEEGYYRVVGDWFFGTIWKI
ncbi:MAG: hypothetical protein J6D02_06145 [Lachnospira sp.]|nr:hypothetical protein [Lachnospira sp.]